MGNFCCHPIKAYFCIQLHFSSSFKPNNFGKRVKRLSTEKEQIYDGFTTRRYVTVVMVIEELYKKSVKKKIAAGLFRPCSKFISVKKLQFTVQKQLCLF